MTFMQLGHMKLLEETIENEGDEGPAVFCSPQTDSEDGLGEPPFKKGIHRLMCNHH